MRLRLPAPRSGLVSAVARLPVKQEGLVRIQRPLPPPPVVYETRGRLLPDRARCDSGRGVPDDAFSNRPSSGGADARGRPGCETFIWRALHQPGFPPERSLRGRPRNKLPSSNGLGFLVLNEGMRVRLPPEVPTNRGPVV